VKTLIIEGADITDTSFTLDVEGFPELIWNITRMERDAFAGKFGEPHDTYFKDVAMGGAPANDPWKHLSQWRVRQIIKGANVPVMRGNRKYRLVELPGIAVMIPHPNGINTCVVPVDGNHRGKARELMGFPSFLQFVVPLGMEEQYRVTIREG
jgi:hypothetical protein